MKDLNAPQENENESIIRCLIDGITVKDSILIPICTAGIIDRSAYIVKQLLNEYGNFTINDVPQFSQHAMLLTVRPKGSSNEKLDLANFEIFVSKFANFLQKKRDRSDTTPVFNCSEEDEIDMDRLSKKLEGQGTIHIKVNSNSMIKLITDVPASKISQRTHEFVTSEVLDFASIQHRGKEFLMSPTDANGLHVGDAISIADLRSINEPQCIIAKLIWIESDADIETLDLFDLEAESDT